jgi:hypothetical protein
VFTVFTDKLSLLSLVIMQFHVVTVILTVVAVVAVFAVVIMISFIVSVSFWIYVVTHYINIVFYRSNSFCNIF